MLVRVSSCIWEGIRGKMKHGKTNPKPHWLDHATDRFGIRLVDETKILLNILVLYLPLPIFWTLFDQQGSRWTFQATRMDGDIGFYEIKPDQAQVMNPILILAFIPLYEVLFYPILNLIGIRRPLQKLALGGILAGAAFFISFFLEMQINKTSAVMPTRTEAHLRVYNLETCDFTLSVDGSEPFILKSLEVYENLEISLPKDSSKNLPYTLTTTGGCTNQASGFFPVDTEKSNSYTLERNMILALEDSPKKDNEGNAKIRVLANLLTPVDHIIFRQSGTDTERYDANSTYREQEPIKNTKYDIFVGATNIYMEEEFRVGVVATLNIVETSPGVYVSSLFSL